MLEVCVFVQNSVLDDSQVTFPSFNNIPMVKYSSSIPMRCIRSFCFGKPIIGLYSAVHSAVTVKSVTLYLMFKLCNAMLRTGG